MEWLSQNAIWILLAIGLVFLMCRGGMGCGIGGHGHHDRRPGPESPRDPVTGQQVDKTRALTSVFREKIYYFESESSRAEFEKDPQRFSPAQEQHHHHGGCC